jgi:hypothetical protein
LSIELQPFRQTDYALQFDFVGNFYSWQYQLMSSGGTSHDLKFATSDNFVHITSREIQTNSSAISINIYEGATFGIGSSSSKIYNLNRGINNPNTMKIITNSTHVLPGNTLEAFTLIANDRWKQQSPELILKTNTLYWMEILNSGLNAFVNFNYVWYESGN